MKSIANSGVSNAKPSNVRVQPRRTQRQVGAVGCNARLGRSNHCVKAKPMAKLIQVLSSYGYALPETPPR
jgi:hypothetical protein